MKPPQILSPCVPADLSAPLFPDLARFFTPRSVALLGATEDQSKFGGRCMRKMIDFGFTGEIMPVNPRRDTILGRPCYASIAELPQAPDHVGIILPAEAVPQALEQCAERGVRFATVFSSGFAEGGSPEGRKLEQRVREIARAGGVRVMGPNCNGLVNFVDGFWMASSVTIQGDDPRPAGGDLAVASQSGGAGLVNVVWRAQHAGLGISYQVSCGNCADLDLLDYAAWMVESEATRVVMVIAERQFDGAKLRALAERAAELEKPIVMVKLGRTETGARAAASHTGALTGNDAVCDAALAQLGVIRVSDYNDLYETAMLLRRRRIPAGARIASTSCSVVVLPEPTGPIRRIACAMA